MPLRWSEVFITPKGGQKLSGPRAKYYVKGKGLIDPAHDLEWVIYVKGRDGATCWDLDVIQAFHEALTKEGARVEFAKTLSPALHKRRPQVAQSPRRVKTPVSRPFGYDAILIIDHGATGTGHQASVGKFLQCLARVQYEHPVHLIYPAHKTRIYAKKLNVDPYDYKLWTGDWNGQYRHADGPLFPITCHPVLLGGAEKKWDPSNLVITSEEALPGKLYEQEHSWRPDANKYWAYMRPAKNNPFNNAEQFEKLKTLRTQFEQGIADKEIQPCAIDLDRVATITALSGRDCLTVFAACDNSSSDIETIYLPKIKAWKVSTRDPTILVLQPFLWCQQNPNRAARKLFFDTKTQILIDETILARNLVPVYPWSSPEHMFTAQGRKAALQKSKATEWRQQYTTDVIQRAAKGSIHLVVIYYTIASSQRRNLHYADILKVLIRLYATMNVPESAESKQATTPNKPIYIVLLGTEQSERNAVKTAMAWAKSAGFVTEAITSTDSKDEKKHEKKDEQVSQCVVSRETTSLNITITQLGRTDCMPLFQRFATYLIIEGNNTWQETLSIGTPALSTHPDGDTQPWSVPFIGAEDRKAATLIKRASDELVTLAYKSASDEGTAGSLSEFVRKAETQDAGLMKYIKAWQTALDNPLSDQFTCALALLDVAVLNTTVPKPDRGLEQVLAGLKRAAPVSEKSRPETVKNVEQKQHTA